MKGLVIRQPWIGMILRGEKTWEMRKQRCTHRGQIALIQQGTGTVVGTARIVDDLPPLNERELRAREDKHGIPAAQIPEVVARGWVRPWVLADVRRLPRPISYDHPSGAVGWVNLPQEVETQILGRTAPFARIGSEDTNRTPLQISRAKETNQLVIDITIKEGGRPALLNTRLADWFELVGILAALLTMICMLGFIIHFMLGMGSSSISALSAFKWLVPMIVSAFIAGMLGQGHFLEDAFGKK